ncbi:MAG: hypothetical protein ABIO94_00470 [Opitutaceae bacterium]
MTRIAQKWPRLFFGFLFVAGAIAPAAGVEEAARAAPAQAPQGTKPSAHERSKAAQFLNDLLPLAWQKRPQIHFNVFTEMTPEGRKWRVPTRDQPIYYSGSAFKLVQTGMMPISGERPPPAAELEAVMKQGLAENGFLPTANPEQRPDILIVFTYGSNGNATAEPPFAEEMVGAFLNPLAPPWEAVHPDAIYRARFIAGDKFAEELYGVLREEWSNMRLGGPVSPDSASPFMIFMNLKGGGDRHAQILNLAFHTFYFVIATAYDFRGVEQRQKIPLWQTRMAVSPQGVTMDEVLRPLILNTGAYLGRETPESVLPYKRIDREGRVEVGTPTVVDPKPSSAAPAKSGQP